MRHSDTRPGQVTSSIIPPVAGELSLRAHRHKQCRFSRLLLLLLALLLGGCGVGAEREQVATVEEPPAAEAIDPVDSGTASGEDAAVAVADGFQNPVFRQNFPDPGVIRVDGTYYAFATNGSGRNVQTARSDDLVTWQLLPDAMPALPRWVRFNSPDVWAPEVIEIDGTYVMYYTVRDNESGRQCLGVATSAEPQGRYVDNHGGPFICQVEEGGSIDASPFRDADGTLYLYWKNDGNCCGQPTWIYVQELAADGLSLVGEPTRLFRNDARWEGNLVEAPTMWQRDDAYFMFYSANGYAGPEYAVGYARCESPLGPCEKAPNNPILSSVMEQPLVVGPGHQTVVVDDAGETWLLYHAWEIAGGLRTDRRFMWLDRLVWEDGLPVVQGPTTDMQPLPQIGP